MNKQSYRLYRKMGFYEKYVKRMIDIICVGIAFIVFGWLYALIAICVRINLGAPVLFVQYRPGLVDPKTGEERIFKMYKFRTMTDERDKTGNLLPDEMRLTKFGAWLRSTSLDELPEAWCILNGTMTLVGPRPQLVRDMVFMTDEQRMRHTARPGLSGLAQVSGRNAITWEEKLKYDLKYVNQVNFLSDMKILLKTVVSAFIKHEGITEVGMATAVDYGDYLLAKKRISKEQYDSKQSEAKKILKKVEMCR